MNRKVALAAVAILIVAAATILTASSGDEGPDMSYTDDIKVKIYGNSNGDDVIDSKDIDIIDRIVDSKMPEAEWKTKYPFADADCDGDVTPADADVVRT